MLVSYGKYTEMKSEYPFYRMSKGLVTVWLQKSYDSKKVEFVASHHGYSLYREEQLTTPWTVFVHVLIDSW